MEAKRSMCIWLIGICCFAVLQLAPVLAWSASSDSVKIAALFDMTGPGAGHGAIMKQAAEFAFEELGWKVAGKKIELILEDTGTDPTKAVDKARKLIERDKVVTIMGPVWGHVAEALYSFTEPYGVPLTLATGTSGLKNKNPERYKNVFACGGTQWSGPYRAAIYAYDVLKYKTVSMLVHDYAGAWSYSEAFADSFEKKGGKIIQIQPVPLDTSDWSPFILNMDKTADFLWLGIFGAPNFLHQYRSYKGGLPIFYIWFEWMPRAEQQEAGADALGVLTTGQWTDLLDTPESRAFVEKYQKAMGRIPGPWDEQQYTATQAVVKSIESAGEDLSYESLVDAYHEISVDSPRGKVSFSPGGWLKSPQYVFEYVKMEDERITLKPLEKYDFHHPKKITWTHSEWSKRQ